jgi:hypothetical protein
MSAHTRGLIQAARDLAIEGCLNDPTDDDILLYAYESVGDTTTDISMIPYALRARIINVYDKWASPDNQPEIMSSTRITLGEITDQLEKIIMLETARDRFVLDEKLRNELAVILNCKQQLDKLRRDGA